MPFARTASRSCNMRGGDAVASVFMDRMLGIASLFLMALVGLTLARDLASNWVIIASLASRRPWRAWSPCCSCSASVRRYSTSLILSRLPGAVQQTGQRLLESIQRYAAAPWAARESARCSLAVQVLRILQAYYLGRGLGIDASLGAYFAFLPLILLVMLLPVTINGLGTGQAAFVWFFARAGVPAAAAVGAVGAVHRPRGRRQPARRDPLCVRPGRPRRASAEILSTGAERSLSIIIPAYNESRKHHRHA